MGVWGFYCKNVMKVCKIAGSLSDIGNQTVDIFIDDLSQK